MFLKKSLFFMGILSCLFLISGCNSGDDNSSSVSGSLAISVPNDFPYNTQETISVTLASNNTTVNGGTGLGFSDLELHTNPSSTISSLTIAPAPTSTCLSITPTSTATTCTFVVTNNNSTNGETLLNDADYTVTGQLAGQTITSNVARPDNGPTGTYWSITINNQTGANQYLFVFGQNLQATGDPYGVVVFDSLGSNRYSGTFHTYSATTDYGSNEDSIILAPGLNTIHIPFGIYGGRAYLSNEQMQDLELNSSGGITTPSFTPNGGSNLNYNTIFDDFEFTYANDIVSGVPHAVVNQTQVDALAVPICIEGTSNYSPITEAGFCGVSRTSLLSAVTTAYDNISDGTLEAQWNSTVLRDGSSNILRIMNPGSADALAGTAPITSFADYLDTYVTDLANSGDYSAANSLNVSLDGVAVMSGNVQNLSGTETYVFTCSGGSCNGQSGTMPLTSANLLTGAAPGGANNATTLAYEMVSSAFMAGQLPPTQQALSATITQNYLRNLSPNTFYESNSVSSAGEYQYSVFSSALKGVQLNGTYTFAYNDVLGVSSTMTETLTPSQKPDPITVTVTY